MKSPWRKHHLTLGILITLAAILIVAVSLYGWQKISAPDRSPQANQTPVEVDATEEEAELSPVMVELPSAEPIEAIKENYLSDSSVWRLVNKSHPLSDIDYRPEIALPSVDTRQDKSLDERSVRQDIIPAVEELFKAAQAAGHELQIGSGFRSSSLQNTYYTNYTRVYGQAAADAVSAKPGYSEHQTGLAIDLTTPDHYCYLEDCFGDTPAGKWLAAHAHEYGFILRYPLEKEGITDFRYEAWHFRYLGKDMARAIYQSGLSYDEAAPYIEAARKQLLERGEITE